MNAWVRGFPAIMMFAVSLLMLYRAIRRARQEQDSDRDSQIRNFPPTAADASQGAGVLERFDTWFTRLCYFVGSGIHPLTAAMAIGISCFTIGGLVFAATRDPGLTVFCGLTTVLLIVAGMVVVRRRAVSQFRQQFPAALDLFSRAIRAGESIDQGLHLLAKAKIGQPSQTEFNRCAGHLDMGLSLPDTLRAMCQRMDLTDVRIFSSAMIAHRDGGGNLATTLERLAAVIRDRVTYRQQLKAVTGASRVSVMLIAGLGPLLFAWLFLVHPEYGRGLWEDSTGRIMLIYAVISECIGLAIVAALLKADY